MLQVNFIIMYIIHKMLVLIKITRILKYFLRSIIDFYFSFKTNELFSQYIMMESPRLEEENIIKDVINLVRLEKLEKETTDTTIKV